MSSLIGYSEYLKDLIETAQASLNSLEVVVTSNKAAYDTAVAAFDSKDVALESSLNSAISAYNTQVAELSNEDSSMLAQLNTHIQNYTTKTYELDSMDASIQSQIDAHIANYNSKNVALDVTDSEFLNELNIRISNYDTKMLALDATDTLTQENINNHVATFTSKVFVFDSVDTTFNQATVDQIAAHNSKMFELDITNVGNQASLDTHIANYESKVASLDVADAVISSNIEVQISAYTSRVAGLDEVDASLQSQLQEQIATYVSKTAELDATDATIESSLDSHIEAYTTKVAELEAANASINSQIAEQIATHTATVQSLTAVDSSLTSTVVSHKAAYDTKIEDLAIAKATLDSTFSSISSQVAGMDTDIITRVSDEIDSKVDQTEFDNAVSSLMAVDSDLYNGLATKVTEIAQAAVDSAQNELIATKLAQATYDSKTFDLDTLNETWETRFRTMEETFKTILATYTITKTDNTPYIYNGTMQNVTTLPPVFGVSAKKTTSNPSDWIFTLQFTPYGYNTLLGTVVAYLPTGDVTITKEDIDPTTLTYDLLVSGSRSDNDLVITLPFSIIYNSYSGTPVFSLEFTSTLFEALPLEEYSGPSEPTSTPLAPIWGRWLESSSSDYALGMTVDSLGNVYVCGSTYGTFQAEYFLESRPNSPSAAGFIVKYSPSGSILWGRWIDSYDTDEGYGVAVDSNDNVYVTGVFNATLQSSLATVFTEARPGASAGTYIIKFSSSGTPLWGQTLDGWDYEQSKNIACDSSNNVVVCGFANTDFQYSMAPYFGQSKPGSGWGAFVFKFDTNGVPQWGCWLDSTANDYGMNIATDSSNNVIVVGTSYGNFVASLSSYFDTPIPQGGMSSAGFVMKFNGSGAPQWGRWIDSWDNDEVFGVAVDATDNVYITGYVGADPQNAILEYFDRSKPSDFSSGYLVKYNSSGVPQWGRWLDGLGGEEGRNITIDTEGNVIVLGFSSAANLSYLNTYFVQGDSPGGGACFIVKFTNAGVPVSGRWLYGQYNTQARVISSDSNNNIYVSGFIDSNFIGSVSSYFDTTKATSGWEVWGSFILKFTS